MQPKRYREARRSGAIALWYSRLGNTEDAKLSGLRERVIDWHLRAVHEAPSEAVADLLTEYARLDVTHFDYTKAEPRYIEAIKRLRASTNATDVEQLEFTCVLPKIWPFAIPEDEFDD